MKKRRTRRERWKEYEREKAQLQQKQLSPERYTQEIQKIAKRLRV